MTGAIALTGCSGGHQSPDDPSTMNNEKISDTQTLVNHSDTQLSNTRLIEIDPPEGSADQIGVEQSPVASVGIQNPSEQPTPVEQIVHPDGAITFSFGDRFTRPLMAHIGCDGEIKQSHASESVSVDDSCNTEDSQGERK